MQKGLPEIKQHTLTPEFISEFLHYFHKSQKNIHSTPGEKISLAIAFANLYLADPGDVTEHHKKILKREFNEIEIGELIALIDEKLIS
jgi:hypothetical protein